MGLVAGGRGGAEEKKEEEEKKKEKISHMCESIGHRPLHGRCPALPSTSTYNLLKQGTGTADHLTLLRLLLVYDASSNICQGVKTNGGNSLSTVKMGWLNINQETLTLVGVKGLKQDSNKCRLSLPMAIFR